MTRNVHHEINITFSDCGRDALELFFGFLRWLVRRIFHNSESEIRCLFFYLCVVVVGKCRDLEALPANSQPSRFRTDLLQETEVPLDETDNITGDSGCVIAG